MKLEKVKNALCLIAENEEEKNFKLRIINIDNPEKLDITIHEGFIFNNTKDGIDEYGKPNNYDYIGMSNSL